jgi:hypothetical protein
MKTQPTPEQLAAIVAYAKAHGRHWKRDLNDAWMRAAEPGLLQQMRNQFGPSWLVSFKLPVEK